MSALVGVLAAVGVSDLLAVSFSPGDPLTSPPTVVTPAAATTDLPEQVSVELPEELRADPLLSLAGRNVTADLTAAGVEVSTGSGAQVLAVLDVESGLAPESYRLVAATDGVSVQVVAAEREGLAAGLFQLGDRVAAGESWQAIRTDGSVVAPATGRRLVDTGAVGITADPAAYAAQDDYVHAPGALTDVILAADPWVDEVALDAVELQWRAYIDRMVSYGYNGVIVPGFLEYVTFSGVGDGTAVYPAGSPYVARAVAMRERVGAMWAYADQMGMDVVFVTDMLALTGPLQAYLETLPTGLDAGGPELWQVYAAGLDELLTELPFVDGLMIRVGEAGAIYNLPGWDYYSALEVTEDVEVRAMLLALTDVAARHDAEIVFRTWTVGVGGIGDLHTEPDTYARVLGDLTAANGVDNLVVSTKFVAGDFDSFLPLNPTLLVGDQPRIVELQARREFEGAGALLDDLAGDHAAALQQIGAVNPNLDGVWVWTQSGGPQRAGPMSLYLTTGFWEPYDLNVWTAARLAWDPGTDLAADRRAWLTRTFTGDPAAVDTLAQVLALSRQAVLDGFYVGPYAEQRVRAFGLEPPPMLWIFKWDLVGGDTATWSAVYGASRGRVDEAVAESAAAVAATAEMRRLLGSVDATSFRDPSQYDALAASLAYEEDLFRTLGAYREAMLRYYEWLDTGSATALAQHRAAAERYRAARAAHVARWSGDLDHPPYEFAAADTGLRQATWAPPTIWLARVLLGASLLLLALLRPARTAALRPWALGPLCWESTPATTRALTLLLPPVVVLGAHAALGSLVSPLYLGVAAATALLFWVGVTGVQVLAGVRRDSTALPRSTAVLGVLQLVAVLPLLVALAVRGPAAAWFGFWLDPVGRTGFVVAAVLGVGWLLTGVLLHARTGLGVDRRVAAASALAGPGAALLGVGVVAWLVGTERFLTLLNDELVVIPAGLSRILGITVHLGIPPALGAWAALLGGALLAVAATLVLFRRPARSVAAGAARSPQPVSPSSAAASQSVST